MNNKKKQVVTLKHRHSIAGQPKRKMLFARFFCSNKKRKGRKEGRRDRRTERDLQGQRAPEWLHWSLSNCFTVVCCFIYLLQRMPADKREAHRSFTLCSCCWTARMPSGEVFWRTDSPLVTIIFIWISFSCFTDNRAYKSKQRSPLSFACFTFLALNTSEVLRIVEW